MSLESLRNWFLVSDKLWPHNASFSRHISIKAGYFGSPKLLGTTEAWLFTGWLSFLSPDQKRQSIEGYGSNLTDPLSIGRQWHGWHSLVRQSPVRWCVPGWCSAAPVASLVPSSVGSRPARSWNTHDTLVTNSYQNITQMHPRGPIYKKILRFVIRLS